jgi:hypothetical protein
LQHVLLLKRQYGFDIFWMILVILKRSLHLSTMTIKLQFNLWSILNFKNAPNIFIFYIIHCVNFTNIRTLVYVCTQNKVFIILTKYLSTNKFTTFTICLIFNLSLKWEKKINQDHWPFSYHSNEWEYWINTFVPFNI